MKFLTFTAQVGGQAVLGRQDASPTPWLTERHGYDPTSAEPVTNLTIHFVLQLLLYVCVSLNILFHHHEFHNCTYP